MTPDEIDKLEAGTELNALVAEHVFGQNPPIIFRRYSTDPAAMMEVVEKMREKFGMVSVLWGDSVTRERILVDITDWTGTHIAHAEVDNSAPLAVCRCALKATSPAPSA